MSPAWPPEDPLLREVRLSELELEMSKDHPVYTVTKQMFDDRLGCDVGMTVMVNFGNIAGLTLGYKLRRIAGSDRQGVNTLWVPQTLAGTDFSYIIQHFGKEQSGNPEGN